MDLKWKLRQWDFNPTLAQLLVVGPTEFAVMEVHRGTLVIDVVCRINIGFTAGSPTVSVGDDGDLEGFLEETDITIASAADYHGNGLYLCSQYTAPTSNVNGKLYTLNDTIEINYTGTASTTAGRLSVIVTYCEIE